MEMQMFNQLLLGMFFMLLAIGLKSNESRREKEEVMAQMKYKKDRLVQRLKEDKEARLKEKEIDELRRQAEKREQSIKPDTKKFLNLMAEYEAAWNIKGLYQEMMNSEPFESSLFCH